MPAGENCRARFALLGCGELCFTGSFARSASDGCAGRAGRLCLCNGLVATIGMGQVRRDRRVQPLVTIGDDLSFLDRVKRGKSGLPAVQDVIDYLLS